MIAALSFAALSLAAIVALAWRALSEQKARGQAETRAAELGINLTDMTAAYSDVTKKHEEQKNRADRLSKAYANLLSEVARRNSAGSYQWLLRLIAEAQADATGDHPGSVPAPGGANAGLDTRLLKPGE